MSSQPSLLDFCLDAEPMDTVHDVKGTDNPFAPFSRKKFVEIFGAKRANTVLFYETLKINDNVIFNFSHMSSSWHLKKKSGKAGVITEKSDCTHGIYVRFENDERSEYICGIESISILNGIKIK